jgi:hypothetical protein
LLPAGFQTSSALAAVSGRLVMMMLVPGIEGCVRLPPELVVPFRARLAQLPQSCPSLSVLCVSRPISASPVTRKLSLIRHSAWPETK